MARVDIVVVLGLLWNPHNPTWWLKKMYLLNEKKGSIIITYLENTNFTNYKPAIWSEVLFIQEEWQAIINLHYRRQLLKCVLFKSSNFNVMYFFIFLPTIAIFKLFQIANHKTWRYVPDKLDVHWYHHHADGGSIEEELHAPIYDI